MVDNIIIRPPIISDLEDIVHINRLCLPENYPVAYFIELIKSWDETSSVAEIDGKIVGYNIVRIERSSMSPWKPRTKSKGHVISIAVLPDYRRRNIGVKLMLFVLDKLIKLGSIKKVTLEVRQSNEGAIKMYQKMSFTSSKILSRYYSDGEDALLMEFEIN